MEKLRMLVLTDHTRHSAENSLYPLVRCMQNHPLCEKIEVATRGDIRNRTFFDKFRPGRLFTARVDNEFAFREDGNGFYANSHATDPGKFDVIWLRLPPPLPLPFLHFMESRFPRQLIINDPAGIHLTGSKEFLLNFTDWCPPMEVCRSIEDVIRLKESYPIVLKPFRDYGGKGIIRIDGYRVWKGLKEISFAEFAKMTAGKPFEYLAVKYLQQVGQGDKRIIVVDGRIIGASLRLPSKDSWLCNVAMGGSASRSFADADEEALVAAIHPTLAKLGIVMYGLDTLMGDEGRRVLSEINTTSIGGLPQIAQQLSQPLVEIAGDLIWNYCQRKIKEQPRAEIIGRGSPDHQSA